MTLALPISVIGANFTTRWMDFKSMCSSAARSEVVWDNFREVRERLALHQQVLADVAGNFNGVHAGIKEHVTAAQEASRRARLLYLIRATKGKVSGGVGVPRHPGAARRPVAGADSSSVLVTVHCARHAQTAGWKMDVEVLHDYIDEMRHHVAQARQMLEQLEVGGGRGSQRLQ